MLALVLASAYAVYAQPCTPRALDADAPASWAAYPTCAVPADGTWAVYPRAVGDRHGRETPRDCP